VFFKEGRREREEAEEERERKQKKEREALASPFTSIFKTDYPCDL